MDFIETTKKMEIPTVSLDKAKILGDSKQDKNFLVTTMAEESRFDNSNTKQTVAILYSQSGLPYLSTNTGDFVNFVELPSVEQEDSLELDHSLEYQRNLVLSHNFVSDEQMEAITNDQIHSQLDLLGTHPGERSDGESDSFKSTNAGVAFHTVRDSQNSLLSEQLVHIPTTGSTSSNQTITLPFSIIDDSGEVSILPGLNQLPMTIEGAASNDDISIPASMSATSMIYTDNNDDNTIILPNVRTSMPLEMENNMKNKANSMNNFIMLLKSNQVGRPPKRSKNKLIGSGPSAISAQGIVQEIDNRLVTVLPRPEDLKKLIETKQLVVKAKGAGLSGTKKKVFPVNKSIFNFPDGMKKETECQDDSDYSFILKKSLNCVKIQCTEDDFSNFGSKIRVRKKRGRKKGFKSLNMISTGRGVAYKKKFRNLLTKSKGPKFIHTRDLVSSSKDVRTKSEEEDSDEDLEVTIDNVDSIDTVKEEVVDAVPDDDFDVGIKKRKLPPRNRGLRYQKLIQTLQKQEYSDEFESSDSDSGPDDEFVTKSSYVKNIGHERPKTSSGPGKRGRPRKHPVDITSSVPDLGGTRIIELGENLRPIHLMNCSASLISDDPKAAELQQKLVITFDQSEAGSVQVQSSLGKQNFPVHPSTYPAVEKIDAYTDIFVVTTNDECLKEENTTIFVEENGEYQERFECSECGEASLYKRDHIRHLRLKHNIRPYECPQCKKSFVSKTSLFNHTLLHDESDSHRCTHCDRRFDTEAELRQHIFDEHAWNSLDSSNKSISSTINKYSKEVKCRCSCGFVSVRDTGHMCEDSKLFVCDICKLKFMSSAGLNRHRKVHDRSIPSGEPESSLRCTACMGKFTFEESLVEHMRTVHGFGEPDKKINVMTSGSVIDQLKEKLNEGYAPKTSELYDEPAKEESYDVSHIDPFRCGICNDSFKDIDVLCDHYTQCHTGKQKLYCDLCMVGCSNQGQLEEHGLIHAKEEKLSAIEPPPADARFPCDTCKRRFRTEDELKKHSKTHQQVKPYKCNFCNADFYIKSALDKHLLVHTGKRPYVCDICLKGFRQSAALVRHKLWTHRLKNQNKCELCGKNVFTRELLLYHLESHGEKGLMLRNKLLKSDEKDPAPLDVLPRHSTNMHDDEETGKRECEYCFKVFPNLISLLSHKISHKHSASYQCDVCHKTFREKKFLKKHKLAHKVHKRWKCDICGKAFATKLTLIRHSHVHLREALMPSSNAVFGEEENASSVPQSTLPSNLTCEQCKKEFAHKSHYVRHMLLHTDVLLMKCGICDRIFAHKSDLIRHKVMHSLMFTCNICFKNFHKRSLYDLHVKKHSNSKPFKCDLCNKSFSTSGNFKTHQRIHSGEKPYHCNMCDYKCSQSGRLLKHKRMHAGVKLAQCKICYKSYSNTESLKSHFRLHTGERPFQCETCHKSFRNNTGLSQHVKDHVKENMLKCDLCPHKFRRSEHLEKHRLFHVMEKQVQENSDMGLETDANIESPLYMCQLCGRVFEKKKYLYNHHNIHSRERTFSCVVCGKQVQSRLALKNHLMIHTGEMPYRCDTCFKVFRNLSNLKRHEKTHASIETYECEVCGDSHNTLESLNKHKEIHVNLMIMNPETEDDNADNGVDEQLYVFNSVDEGIASSAEETRQLIVQNPQSQFIVDNPHQSLLVFPEQAPDTYEPLPPNVQEPEIKLTTDSSDHAEISLQDEEEIHETSTDFMINSKIPESTLSQIIVDKTLGKPHQCDVCFKFFAKKQYLTKHKYRHRDVKPHACDICGKRFAQKFEVAVHKLKHTGERPYQCEICVKDFRSKVNLINHRMRHTGEYPYLCSVCNKGLSTQLQLERHVSLHTGAQPFQCEICERGFSHRISLMRHLAKSHNFSGEENLDSRASSHNPSNMEVMEAISTISNIPVLAEDRPLLHLMSNKKLKDRDPELGVHVENIPISDMDDLEEEGQYSSVVSDQPDYILGTTSEMDAKFFTSILHQVRVEADCDSDTVERNEQDDSDL